MEIKALRNFEDFVISIERETVEQMSIEYKNLLEIIISKSNLVICEEVRLNKQEPIMNIGDPESRAIVSFENNSLYQEHHFINGYPISVVAFEAFKETGNIGSSLEEKAQEINKFEISKAQSEREKLTPRSFYTSLA